MLEKRYQKCSKYIILFLALFDLNFFLFYKKKMFGANAKCLSGVFTLKKLTVVQQFRWLLMYVLFRI